MRRGERGAEFRRFCRGCLGAVTARVLILRGRMDCPLVAGFTRRPSAVSWGSRSISGAQGFTPGLGLWQSGAAYVSK